MNKITARVEQDHRRVGPGLNKITGTLAEVEQDPYSGDGLEHVTSPPPYFHRSTSKRRRRVHGRTARHCAAAATWLAAP
ncbi:hypothetical protein [Actinoplanes nipponensis]